MTLIAVTGRKGGSGKTTLCAHLCGEFSHMGHQVLALDADPQQSLIRWAGMGEGLLHRIVESLEASSFDEFNVQVQAAAKTAGLVFLDTPPTFTDMALWAHLVADLALIPVSPSPLDIFAAGETLQVVREANVQRRSHRPKAWLVPNRVRAFTSAGREIRAALEGLGAPVAPSISLREAAATAALRGLTLAEYSPSSPARREFSVLARAIEEELWIKQGALLVQRPG
ncbi:MAG: ParA family protein [Deltaproteobacteria bacterium]|nr:ParA family protein [Deltaproteobacteria bacterium]